MGPERHGQGYFFQYSHWFGFLTEISISPMPDSRRTCLTFSKTWLGRLPAYCRGALSHTKYRGSIKFPLNGFITCIEAGEWTIEKSRCSVSVSLACQPGEFLLCDGLHRRPHRIWTVILNDQSRIAASNVSANDVQLVIDRHVNSDRRDRIHGDIGSLSLRRSRSDDSDPWCRRERWCWRHVFSQHVLYFRFRHIHGTFRDLFILLSTNF